MKAFIAAIILMISTSTAAISLSAYANEKLDEIIVLSQAIQDEGELNERTRECIKAAMQTWERNEKLFHVTMDRSDMINAKKEIATALGASKGNSEESFLVAAERIAVTLDNIKGYTKLRFENVF